MPVLPEALRNGAGQGEGAVQKWWLLVVAVGGGSWWWQVVLAVDVLPGVAVG